MPEYTVLFPIHGDVSVKVEAENYVAAIDLAYEELPDDICAHCSGWGKSWTRWVSEKDCTEAGEVLLDDKTVWKETKPDPFAAIRAFAYQLHHSPDHVNGGTSAIGRAFAAELYALLPPLPATD